MGSEPRECEARDWQNGDSHAPSTLETPEQLRTCVEEPSDPVGEETEAPEADLSKSVKKKAKKKKSKTLPKAVDDGGAIPPPRPNPPAETDEEGARWRAKLVRCAPTYPAHAHDILSPAARPTLDIFRTPSCAALELRTERLVLRQVQVGDTAAIRRIKTEPLVNRTQLYGQPSVFDIRDHFQARYVRSSIPRLSIANEHCRDAYIFAITLQDPSAATLNPPGKVKPANRLTSAEGYIGNIGLALSQQKTEAVLMPVAGRPFAMPSLVDTAAAGLDGSLFYELHPQLHGQGLMGEAVAAVLRFAVEDAGCARVYADPTRGNEASVALCTRNGLQYERESTDNAYGKPQLFYRISRQEWFDRNRAGVVLDHHGGQSVCRWCMDPRAPPPTFQCEHCDWARYCSRECQYADWALDGGHQAECGQ
ncbi:hypothetical protein Q5752_000860 [Cryptotrichosporon argae]